MREKGEGNHKEMDPKLKELIDQFLDQASEQSRREEARASPLGKLWLRLKRYHLKMNVVFPLFPVMVGGIIGGAIFGIGQIFLRPETRGFLWWVLLGISGGASILYGVPRAMRNIAFSNFVADYLRTKGRESETG